MAIYLVEGPPGAGKTAYAARTIARALAKGTPVVTNVTLRDDFADFIGRRTGGLSKRKRAARAARAATCLYHARDLSDLFRVRLRGRGEERGLMVLDEMGSLLNSRAWSKDDRAAAIEWFAQHRKLGFRVLIIAQDGDMLDKQVRLMVEQTIRLRNLRGFKRWGIPVIPVRFFVAMWTWEATGGRFITKREGFRLGWWKDLYDTTQIVAGDYADDDPGAVVLPRLQAVA